MACMTIYVAVPLHRSALLLRFVKLFGALEMILLESPSENAVCSLNTLWVLVRSELSFPRTATAAFSIYRLSAVFVTRSQPRPAPIGISGF